MTSGDRRPRAILALAGALFFAAMTLWFFTATDEVSGHTARLQGDGFYYHAYLPTLLLDGDLDFEDEYRVFGNFYRFGTTAVGRRSNVFGIGPALFEAPFFLVGHLVARAVGVEADGFSRPEVRAALYPSLLYSLGALFFAWRLLARRLGGAIRPALVVLLAFFGGPVVFYAVRQPGYAHPFATFFTAWLIDAFDASFEAAAPRSLRVWLGLGTLLGLATLARPQLAPWGVLCLLAAGDDIRQSLRAGGRSITARLPARWAAGAAAALLAFSPQLLAWKAIHGSYFTVPQGADYMRWDAPAWSEVLFSSRNGLLPWAPLYALAAIGLVAAIRRHPLLACPLIAGVALQVLVNGAAWDWWAGGSFGGRRFDSCFPALAFGLGYLLIPQAPSRIGRVVAGAVFGLAALLAAANTALATQYSAPTVRIHGGEPAAHVIRGRLAAPLGSIAATASRAANLPARLVWGWRYGSPADAYDSIVGEHVLEDRYPGLNADRRPPWQSIPLAPSSHAIAGLEPTAGGPMELAVERARMLLAFNHLGETDFVLQASAGGSSPVDLTLSLNGIALAHGVAGTHPTEVRGRAASVRRGTNVLVIEAPAGTRLHSLEVFGPD